MVPRVARVRADDGLAEVAEVLIRSERPRRLLAQVRPRAGRGAERPGDGGTPAEPAARAGLVEAALARVPLLRARRERRVLHRRGVVERPHAPEDRPAGRVVRPPHERHPVPLAIRHVPARANVQQDDDDPDAGVRQCEAVAVALERGRDGRRKRRDAEHPEEREDPVDDVVRVEAGRIEREPGPRPDDRHEEAEVDQEAAGGDVVREARPELGDRDDEHEVEEELEPGRVTLLVALGGRGPEPRRLEKAAESVHRGVLASRVCCTTPRCTSR